MGHNIDLEGAIDIHGHCGPSPYPRKVDGYEFAAEAADAGMDAIVMKEHLIPTAAGVSFIDRLLERDDVDVEVFGGVVLNYCNGGFNPFAVQTAIDYGAKFVWAPTVDARNQEKETGSLGKLDDVGATAEEYTTVSGLSPLTETGELTEEARLCIEKVVDNDIAFGVGHLSYEETERMVEYAAGLGHDKIVIDHPRFITEFSIDQQRTLVSYGAYINFVFASIAPAYQWLTAEELYENIRAVGVDNSTVSSGMGQIYHPSSPEGLRVLGETLYREGLSTAEYDTLVKTNPAAVLGLSDQ